MSWSSRRLFVLAPTVNRALPFTFLFDDVVHEPVARSQALISASSRLHLFLKFMNLCSDGHGVERAGGQPAAVLIHRPTDVRVLLRPGLVLEVWRLQRDQVPHGNGMCDTAALLRMVLHLFNPLVCWKPVNSVWRWRFVLKSRAVASVSVLRFHKFKFTVAKFGRKGYGSSPDVVITCFSCCCSFFLHGHSEACYYDLERWSLYNVVFLNLSLTWTR